MADTTLTVRADTSEATRAVSALEGAFRGLKSQLLGLGIGGIITQTNQFALSLDQASKASGVALGTVASFSKAVSSLGGDAGRAAGDVIDFVAGLDAAKNGSASAQISLAKIGVTLNDLGTLSNQDLFQKTVQGIAKIGDASTRNALAVQMLGRSFKDIDVRDVAAKMAAGTTVDTSSIKSAAEAQKNLSIQLGKLQEALLNVIKPLNDLVSKIDISVQAFESLIKVGGAVAATLLFTSKAVGPLTDALGVVYRAIISFAGSASKISSIGTAFASVFATITGPITTTLGVLSTWFIAIGRGTITLQSGLYGLAASIALVGKAFLRFIPIAGWMYAAAEAVNFLSIQFFKFDILDAVYEKIKRVYNASREYFGLGPSVDADKAARDKLANLKEEEAEIQKVRDAEKKRIEDKKKVVDAFRGQRLEQDKVVAGYKLEIDNSIRQLDFQNKLIGKTEEERDKKTRLFEIETAYIAKINEILARREELRKAAISGTDEEKATFAAYAGNVQNTIMALAEQFSKQYKATSTLIDQGQGLALLEKDRENTITRITLAMEQQAKVGEALASARLRIGEQKQDLKFERSIMGFGAGFKEQLSVVEQFRKASEEAQRAFASTFDGEDITSAQAQQLADGLAAIAEGYAELTDQQLSNMRASQEWSNGWREAFQTYAENASNSANQAKGYFETFTKGWEDAIVNFVKTGKLSFKDLAESMIAEFAKVQAQKMFVQLFGSSGNTGAGLLGPVTSFLGGLFGKAGGGSVQAGNPYVIGESGKELFIPASNGTIVPNNQLGGGGTTNINYNIQAVDASSFRTLVARDPQFIYAVTEQGRRSQPSRRLS